MFTLRFVTAITAFGVILSFVLSQSIALAAGGAMTNGGNYTGTIVRGALDQWTFSANAGDAIRASVSVNGSAPGFQPTIVVRSPSGGNVISCDSNNVGGGFRAEWCTVLLTAAEAGTYTIVVGRSDLLDIAGPYILTLAQTPGSFIVPAGDDGGAIANGATVGGSLLRGDID
jgi:hypothetical protein